MAVLTDIFSLDQIGVAYSLFGERRDRVMKVASALKACLVNDIVSAEKRSATTSSLVGLGKE